MTKEEWLEEAKQLGEELAKSIKAIPPSNLEEDVKPCIVTALYAFAWLATYMPELLGYVLASVEDELKAKRNGV